MAALLLAQRSTLGAARWGDARFKPVAWQYELAAMCDGIVNATLRHAGVNVALSAPPRHGKSLLVGRSMGTNAILQSDEPMQVLYATSSTNRAVEIAQRVRANIERIYQITQDEQYAPGRIWGQTEWETAGGHAWASVGVTSSTGGIGCRLLILDDLIGTHAFYRSAARRKLIRRLVSEDLLSRVMRRGSVVHMETRRGVLDTTAWLMENFGSAWSQRVWACHDPARGEGDAAYLWPEQYGVAWRRTRPDLTDASAVWRSLYQQEPVSEGGTVIDATWLDATYPESPEACAANADRIVAGVDLSRTKRTRSDHSAIVVIACRGAYRDIVHVTRKKMSYPEARRVLVEICAEWKPSDVVIELASGGQAMVDELAPVVPGIRGANASTDKVSRLTPHLGKFAAGQVRTPRQVQPWSRSWRAEHEAFTGVDGEEDDQVDATVWALVAADSSGSSTFDAAAVLRSLELGEW